MLRAWMTESVKPASHHDTLPGRWIAEPSWPPPGITPRRLFLTDEGLRDAAAPLTARAVCSPQTVGKCSGDWVPFGRGRDQAGDQQEDDARSLVFETPPLDTPIEILGAAIVTLDVASDRPIANLVVRLCDVHPSGESLRVSYGVLNLTHRESHEQPALLAIGERYRVRIQLNDAGSVFPAGHKVRLAISTDLLADDLAESGDGDTADLWLARSICRNARPTSQTPNSRRFLNRRRRHPRSRPSFVAMVCGLNASTASVWNWARSGSRSIMSRRTIRSAPSPNCDNIQTCRETNGKSGSRRRCGCHPRAMPSCCREVCAPGRARRKCVVATGIVLFLEISHELESSMNQVQVDQKTYQMPPQDGFTVAHFITVADIERSARFYETVFGGRILSRGDSKGAPGYIQIANMWLIVNVGGGPTPDKPSVTLSVPADPNSVNSFMNIRVADIQACYELWRSRGAEFITEPKDKYGETRCYIRDPDGYIIEVGQSQPGFAYG